jgi:uncharacterized membrane protein
MYDSTGESISTTAAQSLRTEDTRQSLGAALFAVGLAAIAAQNFVVADFLTELQPLPAGTPASTALAYLNGAALLAATACIALNYRARLAGLCTTILLGLWIMLLHVPRLIANPTEGAGWTPALEILAMAAAAWMVSARSPRIGHLCLSITLPAFGVLHFIYWQYVASVIPGWIPGHIFWAYFTGVAHVAAGVAIVLSVVPVFKRLALLAASCWTLMVGLWVVLLHIPRVLEHIDARPEWTSLFVAITLCGGGLLMRQTLARAG